MFSASGAGYVVAGLMMNMTEQAPVEKTSTCFNQDTSFLLAAAGSHCGYVCASRLFFVASFITNTIFPPQNDAHGSQVLNAL